MRKIRDRSPDAEKQKARQMGMQNGRRMKTTECAKQTGGMHAERHADFQEIRRTTTNIRVSRFGSQFTIIDKASHHIPTTSLT